MVRHKERVIQTRLGQKTISQEKIIYFPHGLIGFEGHREFVLLQIKEGSPFLILQSMTTPKVGLVVSDPFGFIPDYEVKIGEAEQKILRIDNIRQVAVLVTVSIPAGQPERTSLNLTGPILVNHQVRRGLQVPQADPRYSGHFNLHELLPAK